MTEHGQMLYMTGFHCPKTKTLCLASFFICVLDRSGFSAYTVYFKSGFKLSAAEMFSFDLKPTRAKNAWSSSTCLLYGRDYFSFF
jgi:hypothetical protein